MPVSERRLLLSIHDVGPRFEREIDALVDRLAALCGGLDFAMLVVPDHWDAAPLSANPAFAARLRGWADAGVEMFQHGWRHRDEGARPSFAARHLTAGEGEFATLGHDEALRRMIAGRDLIENAIGGPVAGFIAPAWLYGPGAHSAMAAAGFALAEDHFRVWQPASGKTLARGPVVTWASRSRARVASSLAFARVAPQLLARLATVRTAVHPGDTGVPALLDSIDATVGAFLKARRACRYRDLLP